MSNNRETPEERRERLRQEERKSPSSSIRGSNLSDLVGGMSWKGTGIMIVGLLLVVVIVVLVFN